MLTDAIKNIIREVDALREQVDDHWQIPADEGMLLYQLVKAARCVSVCEIGTSYGFSTLHLAAAARGSGGYVHTIDAEPRKTKAATEYLKRAGLLDAVTLHTGKAQDVLKTMKPAKPFDFAFIDAWKDQSFEYLEALMPHLGARAILTTDNISTHPDELSGFVKHLRSLPGATSCPVDVGNGFELTILDR
ncbi:MAG: methyltransferase [Planctomycetes bacterium]|nr:methyltransferase [Planctomycetota bacterium]